MYNYQIERPFVFTDAGARKTLEIIDILKEKGSATSVELLGAGVSWENMACQDWLEEIGYLEVDKTHGIRNYWVYKLKESKLPHGGVKMITAKEALEKSSDYKDVEEALVEIEDRIIRASHLGKIYIHVGPTYINRTIRTKLEEEGYSVTRIIKVSDYTTRGFRICWADGEY
jgi:hypothetical protein